MRAWLFVVEYCVFSLFMGLYSLNYCIIPYPSFLFPLKNGTIRPRLNGIASEAKNLCNYPFYPPLTDHWVGNRCPQRLSGGDQVIQGQLKMGCEWLVHSTFRCPKILGPLNQEPLDTSDKGYQPPLDESLVKEVDPEDLCEISC